MFATVVKFNNILYECGDIVAITKKDGTAIVGSITIPYNKDTIYGCNLILDISEKYQSKTLKISFSDIASIQKVN